MIAQEKCSVATLSAVALLMVGSTGCLATRKYVQTEAVAPMQNNIQAVDKKVDTKTAELDQRISDVDRRSEEGYSSATAKADTAEQDAQKADQEALAAHQTADQGVNLATRAQQQIENIDNYQPVKTESVLFAFSRSDLTADDRQQLQDLAQSLSSLKHYAIEVEGFTDRTGTKLYNLELSRQRADTVVRYLTENDHVPLVKIHVIGLGADEPAADNHTRAGRKQNRRVEIRIMAPPEPGQQAQLGTAQHDTANSVPTTP